MTRFGALMLCVIVLHLPGGGEFRVYSDHIHAVRAVPPNDQVHHDVRSLVYLDGKTIGVVETPEAIEALIEECE